MSFVFQISSKIAMISWTICRCKIISLGWEVIAFRIELASPRTVWLAPETNISCLLYVGLAPHSIHVLHKRRLGCWNKISSSQFRLLLHLPWILFATQECVLLKNFPPSNSLLTFKIFLYSYTHTHLRCVCVRFPLFLALYLPLPSPIFFPEISTLSSPLFSFLLLCCSESFHIAWFCFLFLWEPSLLVFINTASSHSSVFRSSI